MKVIDFGGATFEDHHHCQVINTRQYRAPEVILHCCPWSYPSDIWGLACILLELYTGDVFFHVHDNYQHLAMIDYVAGPFPVWMARRSPEFSKHFEIRGSRDDQYSRYDWPKHARSKDQVRQLERFPTLQDLLPRHLKEFKDFLQSMLKIDPARRPSPRSLLRSSFFMTKY